ncbi:DNA mismatch repair endonuclease MutL [Paenibacillaceae bacterium]|nr:DNA mismatch repair endonuclease MutL [Paenibacillaceae bacterium]
MARIHVLDEQLSNQIAAGEVVERPSSVVKELVENAIDAGSETIDITIEEGGLNLIRVTDNGAGIEADDLEKAFQRHATSKLLDSKDLFRIASLGFRGEALPSIAAVARVECLTSTERSGLGSRIEIEGGKVRSVEAATASQGTDMIIRDLFYNTPARLKYMKSIQTELGHISDYVYRLAMAHPGIAFTLKHNGNVLLRTLGNGERLQVIAAVYGTNTAKAMLKIEGDHPDYVLNGYLSKPELTRANRNGMTTIVNGRYIRSFALNQAILQAYHTLLPINRFPLVVLEIGMHPALVDVNVHPSKMEVRFSKEVELKAFVEKMVRETLATHVHIPGPASSGPRAKPEYVQGRISFFQNPDAGIGASDPFSKVGENGQSKSYQSRGQSYTQQSNPGQQPASQAQAVNPGSQGRTTRMEGQSGFARSEEYKPQPNAIPRDAAERLYKPAGRFEQEGAVREASAALWQSGPETERVSMSGEAQLSPRAADSTGEIRDAAGQQLPDAGQQDAGTSSQVADAIQHDADAMQQDAATSRQIARTAQRAPDSMPQDAEMAQKAVDAARQQDMGTKQQIASPAYPDGSTVAMQQVASTTQPAESTVAMQQAAGTTQPATAGVTANADSSSFPELSWIGQLHGTYLIAQNEEGMYLIDQHAAHERIHYEYYYDKFGRPQDAMQPLIVPFTLEFTSTEAMLIRERIALFEQAGVELEPFGPKAFLVRSHPQWLPQGDEQAIIEEIAEWILSEKKSVDIAKLREKSAIMCSCKASIKANMRLSREEGEMLLRRLSNCSQPYTCPHGRPIVVHVSTYQLEKMFKRVMS